MTRHLRVARVVLGVLVGLSIVNAIDQAATHVVSVETVEIAFGALKVLVGVTGGVALRRIVVAPRNAFTWLVVWAACGGLMMVGANDRPMDARERHRGPRCSGGRYSRA